MLLSLHRYFFFSEQNTHYTGTKDISLIKVISASFTSSAETHISAGSPKLGHLVHTCQSNWDELQLKESHLSPGQIETLPRKAEEHEFYN